VLASDLELELGELLDVPRFRGRAGGEIPADRKRLPVALEGGLRVPEVRARGAPLGIREPLERDTLYRPVVRTEQDRAENVFTVLV